jgi:hypothetical protein
MGTDKHYVGGFTLQRWNAETRLPDQYPGRLAVVRKFYNFQSADSAATAAGARDVFFRRLSRRFWRRPGGGSGLIFSWQSSVNHKPDYGQNLEVGLNYSYTGSRSEERAESIRKDCGHYCASAEVVHFRGTYHYQTSRSTIAVNRISTGWEWMCGWVVVHSSDIIFRPHQLWGNS